MMIKLERYEGSICQKELIFNVERAKTFLDENENEILELQIKNKTDLIYIPLTYMVDEDSHPACVNAVWIMNSEGKTIERLV